MGQELIIFFAGALHAAMPLLFATLGELMTEKSGQLNLGVEGMMLMGAVVGFGAGLATSSPIGAMIGALLAGGLGAAIFAFLTVTLRANQVVAGLALTIFGSGFSSFLGVDYVHLPTPEAIKTFFLPVKIPLMGDIPFLGPIFFHQDCFVYLGYLMAVLLWAYLRYTSTGLSLRAVGENPAAADAAGVNISMYKYAHIIMGGALCGLAGGYLSVVYVAAWQENITAGRGWIAVALVIFSRWNPLLAFGAAFFIGILNNFEFKAQQYNLPINQYVVDMFPYLATIIAIVAASILKSKESAPPKGLSIPYFREDR